MEHKKIKVKGGIVHYWIDRAEKSQSCIVFSHGVTADHTMFEKQIACFCGKYTILLWDIPMYGLSRPYVGFSYQDKKKYGMVSFYDKVFVPKDDVNVETVIKSRNKRADEDCV